MRRSANGNDFPLIPAGSWSTRNDNGSSSPNREEQGNQQAAVPWTRLQSDDGGSTYAPWRLFEERVRTGPFGLRRFPSQPHSPVRILILDTDGTGAGAVDPELWQFVRNYSPPRIRGQWNLGLHQHEPEDPGLTEEEFNKAMKKLRRHVHNPTSPRRKAWPRGLFSNRNVVGNQRANSADGGQEEKEEGKDCAICLESFGANEQVMMTPCNHMFHHDCIVPWVKSRGQCPVCRLELCERAQQRRRTGGTALAAAPRNINLNDHVLWDEELFYLVRAMEEAFNWINLSS